MSCSRTSICVALGAMMFSAPRARGDPSVYEPGADPAVGFNLISWWNFGTSGPAIWQNAVQSIYDAGFREVSVSPVRYFNPATGAIATSHQQGPELAHVAAGVARAKALGMTVTVNPFVEFDGFTQWRGAWNPASGTPAATTFWGDYQQYMTSVAQMAQANRADFMNVGTELKALTANGAHNVQWNSVINAINGSFSGPLGYAANWDEYRNPNLTSAIWDHPAIDYLGIDAYFPMATSAQADASGTRPNPAFVDLLENNWNTLLDTTILPFAQARKGGAGMPVVLSEFGNLPFNRGVVQHSEVQVGTLDQDEQIMAFEALLAASDKRQATDALRGIHLWQWGMPGSDGSLWNMTVNLPDPAFNAPATQFLADFITHPIPEPSQITALSAATLAAVRARRPRRTRLA